MAPTSHAYVSSYERPAPDARPAPAAPGLHVFAAHPASGRLAPVQSIGRPNPTWITTDKARRYLYACYGPNRPGAHCGIDAYTIDPVTGQLAALACTGIGPGSPAQLAVAPDSTHMVVANYGSGEYTVHRLGADGSVRQMTDAVRNPGSGPHPRQDAAHPHAVAFTPDGRFLVAADLGTDTVQTFRLMAGRLHQVSRGHVAPGSGPRHVAFAAGATTLYVIGELDGDITTFAFDPATGQIGERLQTVPTSPPTHTGPQSAAEIALHPSGRLLYASNRGSQTLAAYRVEASTGLLTTIAFTSDNVAGPTNFAITPSGDMLYVNSSETDLIVPLRIDQGTGQLHAGGNPTPLRAPNVMQFGAPPPQPRFVPST
ncbi:lactonase family protein [Streptomyces sp. NPDC005989]|uniref:lactonase family protein n=1 Tax=Streptomyces sp. NPDC005989 TaxID=3156727 RepID=UPI0033C5F6E0